MSATPELAPSRPTVRRVTTTEQRRLVAWAARPPSTASAPAPLARVLDHPAFGQLRVVAPDRVPEDALVLGVVVLSPGPTRGQPSGATASRPTGHAISASGHAMSASAESPLVAAPGLVLDARARTVMLDGDALDLTRREFDLLQHLSTHPGRAHSRNQLLQSVWEFPDTRFSPERTVDVHVSRLRSKLGPVHGRRLQTVRGIGYRWNRGPATS